MSDNELEVDYQSLANQINAKIQEAAEAMKAANALAKAAGFKAITIDQYSDEEMDEEELEKTESLGDLVDIYPLFNELDEAGWRTSSIGC
jgi:hypothetical protein